MKITNSIPIRTDMRKTMQEAAQIFANKESEMLLSNTEKHVFISSKLKGLDIKC